MKYHIVDENPYPVNDTSSTGDTFEDLIIATKEKYRQITAPEDTITRVLDKIESTRGSGCQYDP